MAEQHYNNLVSKVWNYAHVLRDQGISYGDYVEQISYLLFLKMDEERSELLNEPSVIPAAFRWKELVSKDGDELELQYRHTLEALSGRLQEDKTVKLEPQLKVAIQNLPGLIKTIFKGAQNKLSDPAKLKRVVSLINNEGPWIGIGVDVKGAIYEGLLERNAAEVKSGAGQYFTPRPLIEAIVETLQPRIGETVHDPACGTGGFLLSAYERMKDQSQDRELIRKLRQETFSGVDIVDEVVRLCAMNLYLHGLGNGESPIQQGDALAKIPNERYNVILTNPPFGKKSSYKVIGEDGEVSSEREDYEREDFKFTTSNKQLNFLQHIMTVMETNGRAGVVLPDNVLFEAGNAGEGIRKRLLDQFDFHTLLRLPTGIFYKQGVKANVLFFDKKPASREHWTKDLWIYDLRTNKHFTLKTNPLQRSDLDDFVACYQPGNRAKRQESERFKRYSYNELVSRDKLNLDIFWLKDDSLEDVDSLPPPDAIAAEIVENLEAALEQFRSVAEELTV
jgi:type I restriction enzyme M protein